MAAGRKVFTQGLENSQLKGPMKEHAFISTKGDAEVTISYYSFNPRSHDWCTQPLLLFPIVPHHSPPHSCSFNQINSTVLWPQVTKFLTVQFPAVACHLVHRSPNIFLSSLLSNTLKLCSSLNVRDEVQCPYKITGKIMINCILICIFLYL
jgi:hypothetical protein